MRTVSAITSSYDRDEPSWLCNAGEVIFNTEFNSEETYDLRDAGELKWSESVETVTIGTLAEKRAFDIAALRASLPEGVQLFAADEGAVAVDADQPWYVWTPGPHARKGLSPVPAATEDKVRKHFSEVKYARSSRKYLVGGSDNHKYAVRTYNRAARRNARRISPEGL